MAVETGSEPYSELAAPGLPTLRIARLAARPEAARWARDCAWVPGTGYCRRRPCSAKCVFREQRAAEAEQITDARRTRRPSQRPGAHRPVPISAALLTLRRLLSGGFGRTLFG